MHRETCTKRMVVPVTPTLHRRLAETAEADHRSFSSCVRLLLAEALRHREQQSRAEEILSQHGGAQPSRMAPGTRIADDDITFL